MINNLPAYISLVFGLTTFLTLFLFYRTIKNSTNHIVKLRSNTILICLLAWLIIQAVLALKNIYNTGDNLIPPRIFLFGILPTILVILLLFLRQKGRQFIDSLPLRGLTWINIVRVPVEIVLYWLFLNKAIPEIMTFAGRNFDIIAGITAPLIAYFGITKQKPRTTIILLWNFISLALLINIVVIAILSAPTPLQKFGFDQPDIAILNFPFNWLPAFIVPVVLFGHLASIRQLLKTNTG